MSVRLTYLVATLLLAASQAGASPLEPDACATLNGERDGLIAAGTKADMARGPEWAKANLAAGQLQKIERLIAIEEQLSFRCGQPVTASPQMKEPPKPPPAKAAAAPGNDVFGNMGFEVPPPKKKAKPPNKVSPTK
jgi:hypothetical protein